jgi:hypothetical protein
MSASNAADALFVAAAAALSTGHTDGTTFFGLPRFAAGLSMADGLGRPTTIFRRRKMDGTESRGRSGADSINQLNQIIYGRN